MLAAEVWYVGCDVGQEADEADETTWAERDVGYDCGLAEPVHSVRPTHKQTSTCPRKSGKLK